MKAYLKTLVAVALISNSMGLATHAYADQPPSAASMTRAQAEAGLKDLQAQLGKLQLDLKEAQLQDDGRVSVKMRNYGLTADGIAILSWVLSSVPSLVKNDHTIKSLSLFVFAVGTVSAVVGETVLLLSQDEADAVKTKIDILTAKIENIQKRMQ